MGLTSENYVDEAERVIKTLIEKDRSGRDVIRLTTSKIRGILVCSLLGRQLKK